MSILTHAAETPEISLFLAPGRLADKARRAATAIAVVSKTSGQNRRTESKKKECTLPNQPLGPPASQPQRQRSLTSGATVTDSAGTDSAPELLAQRMTTLLGALKEKQDEAVFAELFRFFAPRVKSYMRKLGAPEDVAEELAQEALAMVWRKAHLFDAERAGAATWIFSIARNLRIDAFRRQRRPELLLDDPTLVPESPDSPESEMDRGQQAVAVRQALATLPDEQAKIVHMSFFEDKPHAAIAEQLGIPLGTVKSRMRLAFQRFRKALGEPES